MKQFETTKLFWGEYLYRISLRNTLSPIFREKNLSHSRQVLDKLQQSYEKGDPLFLYHGTRQKPIAEENFFDAKRLYIAFSRFENYKVRVESTHLSIYSNDLDWIEKLSKDLDQESLISIHKPNPNFTDKLDKNIILIDADIGYEYKVTLGYRSGSPEFARWAEKNPKMIKVGTKAKQEMMNSGYVSGMYFYARDERTLQLCNLMLSNIRRIDKLVVKQDIDK